MNGPTPDENVRVRMQGIRCGSIQDLEDVSASAHKMVDWRHYVGTYPWVCLGTATALGFLVVPRRSMKIYAELATQTTLARAGHSVVEPSSSVPRRLITTLLAIVASMAVRSVIGLLAQSSARVLGIMEDAPPRPLSAFDGASDGAAGRREWLLESFWRSHMISIACPASSKDDVGESSLKLNRGVWGGAAEKYFKECAGDRAVCRPKTRVLPRYGTIRGNRTRMVGETTMNVLSGSTPEPPNGVTKDMGELTHDIVSLADSSSSCSEATAAMA